MKIFFFLSDIPEVIEDQCRLTDQDWSTTGTKDLVFRGSVWMLLATRLLRVFRTSLAVISGHFHQ